MTYKKNNDIIDDLTLPLGENTIPVYAQVISDTEKKLIHKVLRRTFGNQSIAAKILGINRNTLRAKIIRLDIDVKRYKI